MEEKNIKDKKNEMNLKKDIANLIGETVKECYGVVGLTKVRSIKNQLVILKKENYVDGVLVFKGKDSKYDIDVHIVVAYGVKVSEVVNEVSKRIAYEANKKYGNVFGKVNVYVDDLLNL